MDKANVRILFLALIAVMFIGQAIYDFVKKNRSQAKHRHPVKNLRVKRPDVTPARQRPTHQAKAYAEKAKPPEPRAVETINFDYNITDNEVNEIEDSDLSSPQNAETQAEELRRAVIWSEILKRKF